MHNVKAFFFSELHLMAMGNPYILYKILRSVYCAFLGPQLVEISGARHYGVPRNRILVMALKTQAVNT